MLSINVCWLCVVLLLELSGVCISGCCCVCCYSRVEWYESMIVVVVVMFVVVLELSGMNRWLSHFTSAENRHILPLLTSLLNTICNYDPVGYGVP